MPPADAKISNSIAGIAVVRADGSTVEILRLHMLTARSYVAEDVFGARWRGHLSDEAIDELRPTRGEVFELTPSGAISRRHETQAPIKGSARDD